MTYLLDTNVVSEPARAQPNPGVMAWLAAVEESEACLSAATWAELRHGVERLGAGRRKQRLLAWLSWELPERFAQRILPVDIAVAEAWGMITAKREAVGRPIDAMDGLIAATAAVHDLALVTRNTGHFAGTVARLINPWG